MLENEKNECVRWEHNGYKLSSCHLQKPGEGQVLIKVAFSTVNPIDKTQLLEKSVKDKPLGSEGSGIIVDGGDNFTRQFKGRKVAFCGQAWSRFCIQDFKNCMLMPDDIDLVNCTNAFINPLTALSLFDIAQKSKAYCIILTAASSNLSQMLNKYLKDRYIQIINIVKKESHIKRLKDEAGAEYILNQNAFDFEEKLSELVKFLKPTLLFDNVGGDLPGRILKQMPKESTLFVMGNLTKELSTFNSNDLFFNSKSMKSHIMLEWLDKLELPEKVKWQNEIIEDLSSGGKIFGTKILKSIPLIDWNLAAKEQSKIGGKGKILL